MAMVIIIHVRMQAKAKLLSPVLTNNCKTCIFHIYGICETISL